MRIGIDLMGSDNPPHSLFNAVLKAADYLGPAHTLIVLATSPFVTELQPFAESIRSTKSSKLTFIVAEDSIAMSDAPLQAVRRKKNSSLMIGIRMLKKKQIDAFVSCGNTGALIASATLSLPRLTGVARPALVAMLPTKKGNVLVLDVGGNVACKANHLVQFAYLGGAFQRTINGNKIPSVGILNIGSESKKGTKEVCQAYDLLKAHCQELTLNEMSPFMNFVGNVEGRDVFQGAVDVLVTDGFTGNVLLKTAEGVAELIFSSLTRATHEENQTPLNHSIQTLQKKFNYAEYPGAIVCGVDGIVIKVHGNASEKALLSSILGAANYIKADLIEGIKKQLQA